MNDEMFDLVRQSVTEHAMTEDERQLERLRVTCEKVLPPMRFLFRILGKPCFPRGELVAVLKCKSGLWNNMFSKMRDSGYIVRFTNGDGTALWKLAKSSAEPNLFDQIAAEIEAVSLSP